MIRPEPTDEELVALVTTLTLALRQPVPEPEPPVPPLSRWARAGREAALAPWAAAAGTGWNRQHGSRERP